MMPGGPTPTEHTKLAEQYETESHDRTRRTSRSGVWAALAVVILFVGAIVLLLSMMPEG